MGELGKLNVRNDGPGAVATYASFLAKVEAAVGATLADSLRQQEVFPRPPFGGTTPCRMTGVILWGFNPV